MRAFSTVKATALSVTIAATALGAMAVPAAAADVFSVNATGNQEDADLGDGVCDTNLGQAGLQCTLRAAIQQANENPEQSTINFAFTGQAVKTISVPTALPNIVNPVTINGYSAANTSQNTKAVGSNAKLRIALKGPASGPVDGLRILAPSTVKGLILQRFRDGIYLGPGGGGSVVAGNFVGVTPNGMGRAPVRVNGVHVDCDSAVTIGGTTKATRNIISGSKGAGILLCEDVHGTTIRGNLIGVGANGTKDLGNFGPGIRGFGTHDVVIGGDAKGAQNVIAYNERGVALNENSGTSSDGVRILGNSFFLNRGKGIDLAGGANHSQKFPKLTSVKNQAKKTAVEGTLDGDPATTYVVRFFLDAHNEREGSKYLAKKQVTTNGAGKATFKALIPKQATGKWITSTATNVSRVPAETSEFSAKKKVQ